MKDPGFQEMLKEQGYNVEEILQQLAGMEDGEEGGPGGNIDLENMDPEELKKNLADPNFCA